MIHDSLIGGLNRLEAWLAETRSRLHLLPLRLLAYVVLVLALVLSNLAALVRWPFAALSRRWRPGREGRGDAGGPVDVDAAALDELVESGRPVLVDFWAEWCGPCVMMNRSLARFAEEHGGLLRVAKVNTVGHPDLAKRHDVRGLPTLILFHDGREVRRKAGALSVSELRDFVEPVHSGS